MLSTHNHILIEDDDTVRIINTKYMMMNKNLRKGFVLMAACLGMCSQVAVAQSLYRIDDAKAATMKLSGTSTLHKWAMNASSFTGDAKFGFKAGDAEQLTSLTALSFSLAVLDLKSGEKKLDKNAYKALKTDKYKNIVYKLTSATVAPGKNNSYLVKTNGNLSIAGVTKPVAMDVYCVVNKDASITCTGSEKLKMSDYDVKPPSFMAGAMKTGNNIVLDFTMVYKK